MLSASGRAGSAQATVDAPRYHHAIIPYPVLSIPGGEHYKFSLNADWVRITSDFPVALFIDGQSVAPVKPQEPIKRSLAGTFEVGFLQWTSADDAIHYGNEFELVARVSEIQLARPSSLSLFDVQSGDFPGQVHIWYGSGNIVDARPGPWWYSSTGRVIQQPGATWETGPFDFCLHQSWVTGIRGTSSGMTIQPAEVELLSMGYNSSQACPQTYVNIFWRSATGRKYDLCQLTAPILQLNFTGFWDLNCIRVPNWALQQKGGSPPPKSEGIYVEGLGTFCQLDDIVIRLNFRGR